MQTSTLHRFSMTAMSCAAAAVLLAACGGGGSGTDAGTTSTASGVEASAAQGTPTTTSTTGTVSTATSTVAPASAWSQCATENSTCTFEGTKDVRYGAGDKWATRTATGSIACNNGTFGDPAVGTQKVCEVSATASTSSTSTGTTTTTQQPSGNTTTQEPTATTTPGPYGQTASAYELTFSDEFNGGFNTSVWNDKIWYETGNATKNYTVEDGKLKIWPQRDASGNFFNRTIDTDGKYYQTYGYFEIDAKLPVGKGTWPAFWLFNHINERRPEMDVMEAYAGGAAPWGFNDANGIAHPQAYAPTVWKGDYDGQLVGSRQYDTGMDLSTGFHKYAVKWEPNKQTYYFDGKEVLTLNTTFSDPMYLMLDLWFGSASGTPDNSTPQGKTNSYEINYIRAWKFK
ncbi:glycoside hydrolase family 16 protein [Noviherbaspirillum denitrificans]|nr:glycoside hydrolase family 16 protein [Noviherbaspirillum denitrificans]